MKEFASKEQLIAIGKKLAAICGKLRVERHEDLTMRKPVMVVYTVEENGLGLQPAGSVNQYLLSSGCKRLQGTLPKVLWAVICLFFFAPMASFTLAVRLAALLQ